MQPYSFTTPRTAHCYSLGKPGPAIEHRWICLHGHHQPVAAQLVQLDTPERLLILPEALSRHAPVRNLGPAHRCAGRLVRPAFGN